VQNVGLLVSHALYLFAAVATIAIGAYLLPGAVKDASDLVSLLPTRSADENTSEAREANRRKALWEAILLLGIRMAPGAVLVLFGVSLLVWTFYRLLASQL
jgi:hypothetical protein